MEMGPGKLGPRFFMKMYKRENGTIAGSTMTVDELRASLADFPGDMPVFASWEGVTGYVRQVNFNVEKFDNCLPDDQGQVLLIDVNEYHVS